ncbi:putative N-acetylmannosaminyltransferase [Clostridium acetireducens DSM 10703]|jgi:N-acetylglucosaminyldiphosphoundecaprenol N-acetyl-beta-D-mannosaminyltransferase|uniref:N-acetylglucosaminyldiphosphoundecaprenol N-acetyl-beta-D-mannosaminyltransferase n=1 Tax=Clostridium acetireducens DSM 10703 TaxID=1121290 RepID=A0A1E8EXW3_9CLOT|nr:WecB/TagA/CpsF family glycosyltransferase [Clostridium acetireducens]OFI05799.1 putative N-acetylmannosaminyltransferase [Clostridium acetireducens DSM 10703]
MFTNILGYNIFNQDKKKFIEYLTKLNSKVHIISGNPEVLYNGLKEKNLFDNFVSENSIIIPDGIGTVIASKILKNPVREKIAGIEVMEDIIKFCEENKKSIYLVGTQDEILREFIHKIKIKYPNIIILGSHNGYFDLDNCKHIIEDINKKNPYVLFVAMGSPRQERFIVRYMSKLNCNIFMGVGGSFDVFAGKVKRAPKWMINLGIEWLYRVIKEPYRIKRLSSIPKFLIKVIKYKT